MNGRINSVNCAHRLELNIDCGDFHVAISKRGTFDGKQQYSWTETAPTSGLDMEYESYLMPKEDILREIAVLSHPEVISNEQQEAIKLFFPD